MIEANFTCVGCGVRVRTYRIVNFRTIPPSIDDRDLCDGCKEGKGRPRIRVPAWRRPNEDGVDRDDWRERLFARAAAYFGPLWPQTKVSQRERCEALVAPYRRRYEWKETGARLVPTGNGSYKVEWF